MQDSVGLRQAFGKFALAERTKAESDVARSLFGTRLPLAEYFCRRFHDGVGYSISELNINHGPLASTQTPAARENKRTRRIAFGRRSYEIFEGNETDSLAAVKKMIDRATQPFAEG